MKTVLAVIVSVLTVTAHAGLPGSIIIDPVANNVVSAELEAFTIDPILQGGLPMAVDAASIKVDYDNNMATLTLAMNVCPPNAMCIVGPTLNEVELPIISITSDDCNFKTIVADKNQLPVDGAHRTLTIVDGSAVTCDDLFMIVPTHVTYEVEMYNRFTAELIKSTSTFTGYKPLAPVQQ